MHQKKFDHLVVLAPLLETTDPDLAYYYDYDQSIAEYKKIFEPLGQSWQWQPVTINNYKTIIDNFSQNHKDVCVINLCDGDEVNGTPGISVIYYLQEKNIPFTGALPYYYKITTSKITMKAAFAKYNIAQAKAVTTQNLQEIPEDLFTSLRAPLIVKPAVSGGSIGLGVHNVINNKAELELALQTITKGYKGWDVGFGGVVIEEFITGPEYTVLVVGNYDNEGSQKIYLPVERVFNKNLKPTEKFLSFDRLWEYYEDEKPMENEENFYNYQPAPTHKIEALKKLSWEAYCAVQGTGYGRVDIREDEPTGMLYVLEVNAQCGLSEDENYTSIGAILRFDNQSFSSLIYRIINGAH
jgi:D-alanine-D-alanine ligase